MRRDPVGTGLAILFGYFSIAVAFGVSGRSIGLSAVAVASFSVFVFAGASQFMAVTLLAQERGAVLDHPRHTRAQLAPPRHVDGAPRGASGNRIPRPVLAFGITDEVFGATATRRATSRTRRAHDRGARVRGLGRGIGCRIHCRRISSRRRRALDGHRALRDVRRAHRAAHPAVSEVRGACDRGGRDQLGASGGRIAGRARAARIDRVDRALFAIGPQWSEA